MQPNSGSGDINLANTTISLTYQGSSAILTYDDGAYTNVANISSASTSGTSNIFTNSYFAALKTTSGKTQFGILVLKDVSGSFAKAYPVLAQGDQVALLINVTAVFGLTGSGLKPGQLVVGTIVPQTGASAQIQFTTPLAYTSKVLQLA